MSDPRPCPWCGWPRCEGAEPREPHHSLCCLDREWSPCWGPSNDTYDRIMREDREDSLRTT